VNFVEWSYAPTIPQHTHQTKKICDGEGKRFKWWKMVIWFKWFWRDRIHWEREIERGRMMTFKFGLELREENWKKLFGNTLRLNIWKRKKTAHSISSLKAAVNLDKNIIFLSAKNQSLVSDRRYGKTFDSYVSLDKSSF